jgi:hypothetical protein
MYLCVVPERTRVVRRVSSERVSAVLRLLEDCAVDHEVTALETGKSAASSEEVVLSFCEDVVTAGLADDEVELATWDEEALDEVACLSSSSLSTEVEVGTTLELVAVEDGTTDESTELLAGAVEDGDADTVELVPEGLTGQARRLGRSTTGASASCARAWWRRWMPRWFERWEWESAAASVVRAQRTTERRVKPCMVG